MGKSKQIAALPFRINARGALEVLLVTSRETQRWVIPKGWPWPNLADHKAAAEEAWEEAGVRGRTRRASLGTYVYEKRLEGGKVLPIKVHVYLLHVAEVARHWPEISDRRRAWMSPAAAAKAVHETQLKSLLEGLTEASVRSRVVALRRKKPT